MYVVFVKLVRTLLVYDFIGLYLIKTWEQIVKNVHTHCDVIVIPTYYQQILIRNQNLYIIKYLGTSLDPKSKYNLIHIN
jgi:hypothetical protein